MIESLQAAYCIESLRREYNHLDDSKCRNNKNSAVMAVGFNLVEWGCITRTAISLIEIYFHSRITKPSIIAHEKFLIKPFSKGFLAHTCRVCQNHPFFYLFVAYLDARERIVPSSWRFGGCGGCYSRTCTSNYFHSVAYSCRHSGD